MVQSEFDTAYHILFLGAKNEITGFQTRDYIFDWALNQFHRKPIKIFQVGAIETFSSDWRVGSGWSDMIFGEYIKKYGGKLTVVDIDLNHLANSVLAAQALKYDINVVFGDAIKAIDKKDHDIYYLDGSNDPQETLDQFNKIKNKKCIILVDDFSIKGTLLTNTGCKFTVHNVANGVGVLDLRNQ